MLPHSTMKAGLFSYNDAKRVKSIFTLPGKPLAEKQGM